MPTLSIITATLNAARTLPGLLASLAVQTCRDFELVVQDANSSDGTLDVFAAYRGELPSLSLVSEPDKDIYDAWNKALDRVAGEWILFLGADDVLKDENTLHFALERLAGLSEETLFGCGTLELLDSHGETRTIVTPHLDGGRALLRSGKMPTGHPALFYRRRIFDRSRFDVSFRIASDLELLCRVWTENTQAASLELVVTRMGAGGISESPFSTFLTRREVFRVMRRHFPGWATYRANVLPLVKGGALHVVCLCLDKERVPAALDFLRKMCGLPPVWTDRAKRIE